MTPESKELFRKAILRVLNTNRTRFGLGKVAISHLLVVYSFSVHTFKGDAKAYADAIADEIDYLTGKGLVEEAGKTISAENRAWRLTTDGIAFVDENP